MIEQPRLELALYGLAILIAGLLAGLSIHNNDATGAAAWSAIMMAVVNAVKEGRQSRTIDRMQAGLQRSSPPQDSTSATGKPDDPVHTVEEAR